MLKIPDPVEVLAGKLMAANRVFKIIDKLHENHIEYDVSAKERSKFQKRRAKKASYDPFLLTQTYTSSSESSSSEEENSNDDDFKEDVNPDSYKKVKVSPAGSQPNKDRPPTTATVALPSKFTKFFLLSLPHCLPLSIGFRHNSRGSHCYCPLSGLLESWRFKHGLHKVIKAPTCNLLDHGKDSIAIIAHIRQKAIDNPYHDLVCLYLKDYYCFNKGMPGYMNSKFAHKAMYPQKSSE